MSFAPLVSSLTESKTEPSADSSASMFSFCWMSSCKDSCFSLLFGEGCEVGPEPTVGAWRSFILRPICFVRAGSVAGETFGDESQKMLRWEKAKTPRRQSWGTRGARASVASAESCCLCVCALLFSPQSPTLSIRTKENTDSEALWD